MAAGTVFLIFVYGTLKTNQPNHYWLRNREHGFSRLVASGKTQERYPLLIGTRYNIPFMLNEPGVGDEIHGEIYEVDEAMLAQIDKLEDHPNYYLRQQIQIITG